jgi:hypothetical protein
MRTTFALISKYEDAKHLVDQLIDKNIDKDSINIIAQKSAVENSWDVNQRTVDVDVTKAVGKKKVEGLDEMLGRQRPVRTTSAGELYAAGEMAHVIAKTVAAPGEIGSLKDALVDFGLEDQAAEQLSDGVQSGGLLIFIRAEDEDSAMVRSVLNDSGKVNHSTVIG